jgi:vitamin B12 transporter
VSARVVVLDSLLLSTAWTFQNVDSATGANVALHSPDHFGNLILEWSPTDAVQVRIAGRAAGDTEDVQIPVPERTRVEGYEVLDLAASWRLADALTLRARLDNATDEEYEQFVGFPQPGRRGRIGIEYAF